MSTEAWVLKIGNEGKPIKRFKSRAHGIDEAAKLITNRFTNIPEIIDETLKYKHTKMLTNLIKQFRNFSCLRNIDVLDWVEDYNQCYDQIYDDLIEENSFRLEKNNDICSLTFGNANGDSLHVETDIWSEENKNNYFIFVKTKKDRIKLCIQKAFSQCANIFLVYQALTTSPQSRAEIKNRIDFYLKDVWDEKNDYHLNITEDTISNQIKNLRYLGIPVFEKRLAGKDRANKAILVAVGGDKYREGFYLDPDSQITPNYKKCKSGTYLMLVYLTLKETGKENPCLTQQAIINAVYEKFGIKLQKQKVQKYIYILAELDVMIHYDSTGYGMR